MLGLIDYAIFSLCIVGIYGLLSLALNVQWGMTGLFNIGIGAFFAIGGYTSGILTAPETAAHIGGFGLPIPMGLLGAMVLSAAMGLLVGLVTLNLRADYLAIATIGIAEIIRLVLTNEGWLTGGVRGMSNIPRPFEQITGGQFEWAFLVMLIVIIIVVFLALEAARTAAWGRVLRAVRENESTALASGKDATRFRLEAFVVGCAIMGLAGALYAHLFSFISPEAFEPMLATFLVWVMLIAGGSGNNKGALLGALVIWGIWSGTQILTGYLPAELATRAGALRIILIGVLLIALLVTRPEGMLSEESDRRRDRRREERGDQ